MEPHSPPKSGQQFLVLEGQLRESFGRVVYSHKTHEKCCEILLARLGWMKLTQIILAALTTGSFLGTVIEDGNGSAIVGGSLALILVVLNTYTKDYDLGELAQKHKQAANELWFIREQYLTLITDVVRYNDDGSNLKKLGEIELLRDKLLNDLHSVYSAAPSTTSRAYRKAQDSLQYKEDMTFSDGEIDAFLPRLLKHK